MKPSQYFRMGALRRSSYYDNEYRASQSLNRARRPYLARNIITGIAVFGFAVGVYAYTINAIGEDDFDDVVPVRAAQPTDTAESSK